MRIYVKYNNIIGGWIYLRVYVVGIFILILFLCIVVVGDFEFGNLVFFFVVFLFFGYDVSDKGWWINVDL